MADVVIAVDQGTSSTKAIALDTAGAIVGRASVQIGQHHPRPGWVEQDAEEIAASVIEAIGQAAEAVTGRVAAVALSTQRESAVIWDKTTGAPLGPVLGWQDRRTAGSARKLVEEGHDEVVRSISGLPIDPMFSALKFAWLLAETDAANVALGTVDSWLVHRLTGEFRIEAGNASRTGLLDLATVDWSDELLALYGIPRAALPTVVRSDEPTAPIRGVPGLPVGIRVHAVLGDSHAALYGHGVRAAGGVKATLGTGSSIMGLLDSPKTSLPGLVTTLAWACENPVYAFEGNILSSGATLVWLSGLLSITPDELLAQAQSGAEGVDVVPAFGGLGAPWWDSEARAVLTGFDLGTAPADLALAAAESVCLQVEDVLSAAETATGSPLGTVLLDGGPAANDWLAQLMADISSREFKRPVTTGVSALGAARLAGVAAGLWHDFPDEDSRVFRPGRSAEWADARRQRWHAAVALARRQH
ncbi:glycerol kinase [Kibdelosporangium banguiense]|uniref:Glycerol kinase n=1 Tax=Kibdelosporangium banguiense TaxID=1365924 RepID=A0ABS4TTY1_9PSEU|nr:FGGY family carbohydrate kinase [Kibdelosporangium banguiense]MBP2327858.1 glycerol kinase [Kibdelosporangium banguiense]